MLNLDNIVSYENMGSLEDNNCPFRMLIIGHQDRVILTLYYI